MSLVVHPTSRRISVSHSQALAEFVQEQHQEAAAAAAAAAAASSSSPSSAPSHGAESHSAGWERILGLAGHGKARANSNKQRDDGVGGQLVVEGLQARILKSVEKCLILDKLNVSHMLNEGKQKKKQKTNCLICQNVWHMLNEGLQARILKSARYSPLIC